MQLSSKADDNELVMQTRQQFIMNGSRCAVEEYREEVNVTWAAANALATEKDSPLKNVGFLPVIPYQITQYSTVYSDLRKIVRPRVLPSCSR